MIYCMQSESNCLEGCQLYKMELSQTSNGGKGCFVCVYAWLLFLVQPQSMLVRSYSHILVWLFCLIILATCMFKAFD